MALKLPIYRLTQYQEPRIGEFMSGRFQPFKVQVEKPLPTPYWYARIHALDFAPETNVYYISKKPNEAAVDSFICYGGYLYVFQFTVSEQHKIKDGPISRFATCRDLSPRQNYIFVFIIPYGVETLECSYPESAELQELSPCYLQVVMENSTTPVASLEQLPHKNQKSLRHLQKNRRLK